MKKKTRHNQQTIDKQTMDKQTMDKQTNSDMDIRQGQTMDELTNSDMNISNQQTMETIWINRQCYRYWTRKLDWMVNVDKLQQYTNYQKLY